MIDSKFSVLAPYSESHDAKTLEWLNRPDIKSTFGLYRSIDLETHRTWVKAATDTSIWAILGPEGQHVGNVLLKVNQRHQSGYFQIYIGEPASQRRGIGDLALKSTLRKAFEELGLHRVWLHTLPDNIRAERLYLKNGFTLEGIERESILVDGRFINQQRWSILVQEWRAKKSSQSTP